MDSKEYISRICGDIDKMLEQKQAILIQEQQISQTIK